MNRNLLIVGLLVLVLAVVGYGLLSSSQSTPTPSPVNNVNNNTGNGGGSGDVMTLTIAEQNNSGEMGNANLVEENGQVVVTVNMTGAEPGVPQPAHIHTGTCPNVGGVVYPLTNVVDGMSETVLDTTLESLRSQLPLGLNVHKSEAEASVYTACGDLTL